MKIKNIITVLLVTTILASCAPAVIATQIDSATPKATTQLTPTATKEPTARLIQNADLFQGSSNIYFEKIATLKSGDIVFPLGKFMDFVKVRAFVNGQEFIGFIASNSLAEISSDLLNLDDNDVPWTPLYDPKCHPNAGNHRYISGINASIFENTTDGYYDTETGSISISTPLHIRIDSMGVDGSDYGSIKILGIPETKDPWWKDTFRMDIDYNNGQYLISIRDGSEENANLYIDDLGIKATEPIQIYFEQPEGKSFIVLDKNNTEIRRVDLTQESNINMPKGLFPEHKIFFGTSVVPHSTLTITGLSIGTLSNGLWTDQTSFYPGLADLAARHNLTVGAEIGFDDPYLKYCEIRNRDFNLVAMSTFSWKEIWLASGEYNFNYLDQEVDNAVQSGMHIRAMHLVWGAESAIPDWLMQGKFSRDEYIQILETHVKTLVSRYKGRVQEWSIANESAARSLYGFDFWEQKIGHDYIEMSFRWARDVDPNAILIINEDDNESSQKNNESKQIIEKLYQTVKTLKEKGVPIDVVGMQMHLLLGDGIVPKKDDVIATMKMFSDLNVKIYITEFDVDMRHLSGTQEQRLESQAKIYRDMLEACLESGVCESFTTWGIYDGGSWLTVQCPEQWCNGNSPDAAPLMFDQDFNPKPAYFAVRDVLLTFP